MIEAFCCEMESMRIYQIADVLEWKQRPFHKLAKRLILTVIMIKHIVEAILYTSQHIKNITESVLENVWYLIPVTLI